MNRCFCICSANYLPNIGGIEKYTEALAHALANFGNHVIIITNNTFNLADHEFLSEQIEIYRLPCFPLINGRLPIPKRNHVYKKLLQEIKERPIDYISINARFYPLTFECVKLAESLGIKPLVTDHGSAYLTLGNPMLDKAVSKYEDFITSRLIKHDIDFYGVSQLSVTWLKHFGIDACGVLNNSIDAVEFRNSSNSIMWKDKLDLPKNSILVVFTGRLIPEKGITALLNTAKALNNRKDIHFAIAGDGPLKNEILDSELDTVHLVGKLDQSSIASLLTSADIFCLPTRSEGFSTSLLEAAASETAAVITDVGGVAELIPNKEYGIVIPNANTETIAEAILELADNDILRLNIAKKIRSHVEQNFSWESTAKKIEIACQLAQGRNND